MSKRCLFITAALVLLCSSAWAQLLNSPWPKIHGNAGNTGYCTNIGTSIGRLKWIKNTGKPVTSSPALDNNGRIYFGSADTYFYCLDRATGNLLWRYKTGDAIEHCSPALSANGFVYIGSNDRRLYAFNLNTINETDPQPAWVSEATAGIYGSPTIANNGYVIFTSADGYFYCIDPAAQTPFPAINDPRTNNVWSKHRTSAIWSTPTIDNLYLPNTVAIGTLENLLVTEDVPQRDSTNVCYYTYKKPTETEFRYSWFLFDIATGTEIFRGPRKTSSRNGTYGSIVIASLGSFLVPTEGQLFRDNWGYDLRSILNFDNVTCTDIDWPVVIENPEPASGNIYATPALLPEGSYFLGHGNTMTRFLPTGAEYFSFTADGNIESSAAVDETFSAYFGCNGGVFYCMNSNTPDNPLRWKYPETGFLTRVAADGSIVPAEIISSPAIDDDAKHSIYFGASDGNMYAFYDGASIKGRITLDGNPMPAVDVILKDSTNNPIETISTDSNGNFEFFGKLSGTYIVRPKKDNYIFNPTETQVTLANTDVNGVDFTAAASFTLIGRVVSAADGTGLPNVSIGLVTKDASQVVVYSDNSTVTDGDGNYTISNVGYGTSTVTPSLAGWGFDPPSIDKTFTAADVGGTTFPLQTFGGTLGYQVSGKVIDATKALDDPDNGIADVTVTITSGTFTDTRSTNPQGLYSFTGLSNGDYTVKPTRALYKFSPTIRSVKIDSASVLDQNFYGATGSTISGTLKLSGSDTSFDGFTINLYVDDETFLSRIFNRNQPRTLVKTVDVGTDGFFIFMGVAAGKYIVEPAKVGYGFDPASEKVTVTGLNDIVSLVFTAVSGFTLSGRMHSIIGLPQSGIGVSLINNETGVISTATSGLDGSYTFTGLASGLYTVIPDSSDFYTASPVSKNVTIALDSVRRVNFLVISFCSTTYITLPFWGSTDATVYVLGTNFGPPPTDNTTNVDITLYDGTTTSKPAGVYFGSNNPDTWVNATVTSWTPVYITAKVPLLDLRILRVWVVRAGTATCINNSPINIFINSRGLF